MRSRVFLGDPLRAVQIDRQELAGAAQVARILGDQLDDPFSTAEDIAESMLELARSDPLASRFDAIQLVISLTQQAAGLVTL